MNDPSAFIEALIRDVAGACAYSTYAVSPGCQTTSDREEMQADFVRCGLEIKAHWVERLSKALVAAAGPPEEADLCSTCGARAKRNRDIFVRHFSRNPPTQKAMAEGYGISAGNVSQIIQNRLHSLRIEGPKDSSEWDDWAKQKAEELGIKDVPRFSDALWGRKVDSDERVQP